VLWLADVQIKVRDGCWRQGCEWRCTPFTRCAWVWRGGRSPCNATVKLVYNSIRCVHARRLLEQREEPIDENAHECRLPRALGPKHRHLRQHWL
jgi:hypothetical protein